MKTKRTASSIRAPGAKAIRPALLATAAALSSLALLAGCGDGGQAGDASAPVVTLSASQTSVEGGETVAITVLATDDTDGTVDPKLSCDSGELVGNLLVTKAVTTDTTITCTATATDAAGNSGNGTLTISVKTTTATLTVPQSLTTLNAGQAGLLVADNLPLTEQSYAATIDGRAITLYRGSADTLGFFVPADLAAGSHRISVNVGARRYNFALTTNAAPPVTDARRTVVDTLTTARDAADGLLSSGGAEIEPERAGQLRGYRTTVADALASVDQMSQSDLNHLAQLFLSNNIVNLVTTAGIFNQEDCERSSDILGRRLTSAGLLVIAAAISVGVGEKVFGAVIIVSGAVLIANPVKSAAAAYYQTCFKNGFAELSPGIGSTEVLPQGTVKALAVAERFGFRSGQTRSFTVHETLAPEQSVAARIEPARQTLLRAITALPFFPTSLRDSLTMIVTPITRTVPSSEISLGSTSRAEISGSKGGAGDTITLQFTAADSVTDNVDFDFTLNRAGGSPISVPAQLTVTLPGADDASITARQGVAVRSSVQIRGADSLEVVDQPAHGMITLSLSGEFTYTSSAQFFGADRFTYRARKKNGVSRTATVLISVERQFDGLWNIETRSTTTSETQQGLCPSEIHRVTIPVLKISDQLYTITVEGVTLQLTMASKDDPAGLAGTITGTYPDDPGQTTETLTVRIPDSTHLNGSSNFRYVQQGASCSGTSTVTGTRP